MGEVAPYLSVTYDDFLREIHAFWFNIPFLIALLAGILSLRWLFKYVVARQVAAYKHWNVDWSENVNARLKDGSKTQSAICNKAAALLWLGFFKLVLTVTGIYTIASNATGWHDVWWRPPLFWRRDPYVPVRGSMLSIYLWMNLSFFLSETVASVASLRHRKDEAALLAHHVITLGFIWLGIETGYVIGIATVLNVHEMAMPFINVSKAMYELKMNHKGKVFGVGSIVVLAGRMVWFPYTLYMCYYHFPADELQSLRPRYLMVGGALQLIHIYFSILISRVALSYLRTGVFVDVGALDEKKKSQVSTPVLPTPEAKSAVLRRRKLVPIGVEQTEE